MRSDSANPFAIYMKKDEGGGTDALAGMAGVGRCNRLVVGDGVVVSG
jgi:alanine dehydrogenase